MVWSQTDTNEVISILARARTFHKELRDQEYDLERAIKIFSNLISATPVDVDGTPLSDDNRLALKARCIEKISLLLPDE